MVDSIYHAKDFFVLLHGLSRHIAVIVPFKKTALQIRRSNRDNFEIIIHIFP